MGRTEGPAERTQPGTMALSDFLLVVLLGLMTKQALAETDSSYLDYYNLDSEFGVEVHEDPFEVTPVDGLSKRRFFNGGSKGLFKLFSKRNPFVQRKHFMEKETLKSRPYFHYWP